eukprot:CAMPEP_0178457624 /NCGR_PEP_ID=MMETSP0689_2-20121128/47117_1 /TAXON_ID=160604 /ORGANISM="Amphidinium massartii, Strain CS-259" /LENGTH=127 /DNA_ID=CAMNT_0020083889 /DNA_START=382 /DNA_END=765 /DNA_ORIENTATION=-
MPAKGSLGRLLLVGLAQLRRQVNIEYGRKACCRLAIAVRLHRTVVTLLLHYSPNVANLAFHISCSEYPPSKQLANFQQHFGEVLINSWHLHLAATHNLTAKLGAYVQLVPPCRSCIDVTIEPDQKLV